MNKKYELTSETKTLPDGRILHRIRSLVNTAHAKAGELGGFIEKESNLSTNDISWVANEAMVYGDAKVLHDSLVSDHAIVRDNALVIIAAKISGHAEISGYARIGGVSDISGISSLDGFTIADGTKMEDFNIVTETSPQDRLYSKKYIRMKCKEEEDDKKDFLRGLILYPIAGVFAGISFALIWYLLN